MKEINCPKCIVEMELKSLAGVNVDVCPRCRGIYLDENELRELRNVRGSDLAANEDAASPETPGGAILTCPRCANAMDRYPFADSEILIDSCPVCSGVWLDAGEFTAIYNYAESMNADGDIDPELLAQLKQERLELEQKREAASTSAQSGLIRFIQKIIYRAGA